VLKKIYHKAKKFITSDVLFPENKELLDLFGQKEKCYILGTSSTINKLDLKQLKKDAVKITIGNFHEHPDIHLIDPSIHIFAASHPPITETVLVNWWSRCHSVLPQNTSILISEKDKIVAEKVFKGRKTYYYAYGGDFPIDFTGKIITPWSVSVLAVQLAIYLKVKETYLLGIEHIWRYLTPYAHFYDHEKPSLEYFLFKEGIIKKLNWQRKNVHKKALYRYYELYQQYEQLNKFADKLEIKVFNGDPNSGFDVFERKYFFS
jgi:hypothetical protein